MVIAIAVSLLLVLVVALWFRTRSTPTSDRLLWKTEGLLVFEEPFITDTRIYIEAQRVDNSYRCVCIYAIDKVTHQVVWSTDELAKPYIDPNSNDSVFVSLVGSDNTNMIFIRVRNDLFYAIESSSGEVLWTFERYGSVVSYASVVDDTVYVIAQDRLWALDKASGQVVWASPSIADMRAAIPIIADRSIYVLRSYYGDDAPHHVGLGAFDISNGDELWSVTIDNIHSYPRLPQIVERQVYFVVDDVVKNTGVSKLAVLDSKTGRIEWTFNDNYPHGDVSNPLIANNTVYVGTGDGLVIALDTTTGNEIWSTIVAADASYAAPLLIDDTLLISVNHNYLYALNASTGAYKWSINPGGYVIDNALGYTSPRMTFSDGILYVSASQPSNIFCKRSNGAIYAIDIGDGHEFWKWEDKEFGECEGYHLPVIDGSTIYVGGLDGLFALQAGR